MALCKLEEQQSKYFSHKDQATNRKEEDHDVRIDSCERPFLDTPNRKPVGKVQSSPKGLSASEAAKRLSELGQNSDVEVAYTGPLKAIFHRLLEPLPMILLGAALISVTTGDSVGGTIIILILAISIGLDTLQEGHAARAADILRESVAIKAEVKRFSADPPLAPKNPQATFGEKQSAEACAPHK